MLLRALDEMGVRRDEVRVKGASGYLYDLREESPRSSGEESAIGGSDGPAAVAGLRASR